MSAQTSQHQHKTSTSSPISSSLRYAITTTATATSKDPNGVVWTGWTGWLAGLDWHVLGGDRVEWWWLSTDRLVIVYTLVLSIFISPLPSHDSPG